MLSIVICGTNDNGGYNLHKRAALTLNTAAELLGADDEILFVDFNTSGDLPTLPEAIADTLTPRAAEKTRIIRLRSPGLTEAQALQAGVKAAAAASDWFMFLRLGAILGLDAGADLNSVLRASPPAPVRLAALPLPEAFWGGLDRNAPQETTSAMSAWAARSHLDPAVIGGAPVYLASRTWTQAPTAGETADLGPGAGLRAYDCSFHGAVTPADWTNLPQAFARSGGNAGAGGVEVFTVHKASADRYVRGLTAVVKEPLSGFLEAAYVPEAYGGLGYHPDHVLPYLLDLVSCVPPNTRIGYVGARTDTFTAFAEAWSAMGAEQPLLTPDLAPWLDHPKATAWPFDAWVEEAEFFVFEVGAETNQTQETLNAEERSRIWAVDYSFRQTAERDKDRQSAGAAPRRALVINGVHNFFEPLVMATLSVTLTPFSSRIRHGYFTDPAAGRLARASQAERDAAAALSRRTAFAPSELDFLGRLFSHLEPGSGHASWEQAGRMGTEIAALAEAGWSGLSAKWGERRRNEILDRLAEARPSRTAQVRASLVASQGDMPAGSRLAQLEDWERPEWARLARLLFPGRPHDNLFERDLWVWERVTLAENLQRHFPIGGGATVLLAGKLPEAFATGLAALDYQVDIVDPRSLSQGRFQAVDWRADASLENWMFRRPLGLASDRPGDFLWDAAIICQNGLFMRGPDGAIPTLQTAVRRVKTGGHVGVSALVQLNADDRRPTPESFPTRLLDQNALAEALRAHVDLPYDQGADLRVTRHSLDRQSDVEYPTGAPPSLVVGRPPHLETLAVLSMTKAADASPAAWRTLAQALGVSADWPEDVEDAALQT
jgi:hypothetical protein